MIITSDSPSLPQSLLDTVTDKSKECLTLQEHTDQLKASLADETRVKIELFQYLSEARKYVLVHVLEIYPLLFS